MQENLRQYLLDFSRWLRDYGIASKYAETLTIAINGILLIVLLFFLDKLLRKIVIEFFKAFTNKTKSTAQLLDSPFWSRQRDQGSPSSHTSRVAESWHRR